MKNGNYKIIVFFVGLLIAISGLQQNTIAQVPSGVMVDSIGAAPNWRNQDPFRSHHIVASANGKMVFITGTGASSNDLVGPFNPSWYYSTNYGATWSVNATPFTNNATAGVVAVAADSSFNIYVVFNRGDSLYFNKDIIGDGTGLLSDVMVNSPGTSARCPDIAVSKDGNHIIITAQPTHGDYDTLWAYVSNDGGNTWSKNLALATEDPSIKPPAFGSNPTFQWDVTSLSMGSNGYAFAAVHASYDTTNPNDHWNLISETTDYGATWTPSWVTPPSKSQYKPTGNAWDYNGSVLAVGSTPHLASVVVDNNGVQILIESHKENGVWVHHAISHPDSTHSLSYEIPRDGTLGVDSQGRIYCVWTDQNLSVNSTYQIFISGSSDGGDTWTQPVRLTDAEAFCSGSQVLNSPQLPQFMSTTSAAIAINGEIFGLFPGGSSTAWVETQFPLSAVWNGPFDKDTTLRVLQANGYASLFGTTGYNWIDITGSGTEVDTLLHDVPSGSPDFDDGNAGLFPIGFNFNFYGNSYSQFEVSANGFMSFTDSTFGWPPPFPINIYKTIIAPLGSDANHDMHNPHLFYWSNAANDTCVIEWYHETSYDTPTDTSMTFEVILAKNDSSVTFEYSDVGPTPATMHVMIKGGTSSGFDFNKLGFVPSAGAVVRVHPTGVTGIANESSNIPSRFSLSQNYPNPFNPTTQIEYSIPKSSYVSLKVYNSIGQEVATLFSGNRLTGKYSVTFDAGKFASGVYFYRLQAGGFSSVKKMILLK